MWCRLVIVIVLVFGHIPADAQFFPPVKKRANIIGASVYKELESSNSYLLNITYAKEYQLRTWFTLGVEGALNHFTRGQYSSIGATIRPVTRMFFNATPSLEVFGETKGGVMFMLPEYPDKLINFVFVANIGTTWYYKPYEAIRFSGGYHHLSNGKRHDEVENSMWDGLGVELRYVRVIR